MTTNDLLVKESSAISTDVASFDSWGEKDISQSEMTIPRLLVMQQMSSIVAEGNAKLGDIVENVEEQVLGGLDKTVQVIVCDSQLVWRQQTMDGELVRNIPRRVNPSKPGYNNNLGKTSHDEDTNQEVVNYRVIRFFFLVTNDDGIVSDTPYIMEFKSTAYNAGKDIYSASFNPKNREKGLNPASYVWEIGVNKQTNGNKTFAVPFAKKGRASVTEEMEEAFKWYQAVNTTEVKIHEGADQTVTI